MNLFTYNSNRTRWSGRQHCIKATRNTGVFRKEESTSSAIAEIARRNQNLSDKIAIFMRCPAATRKVVTRTVNWKMLFSAHFRFSVRFSLSVGDHLYTPHTELHQGPVK